MEENWNSFYPVVYYDCRRDINVPSEYATLLNLSGRLNFREDIRLHIMTIDDYGAMSP